MGQRHQVYVNIPKVYYNPKNPNNRPSKVIGLHHQWMYGFSAIRQLNNYLQFLEQEKLSEGETDEAISKFSHLRDTRIEEAQKAFEALYSCSHKDGYYHRVHSLGDDECENPMLGDNNDGITIIDASGNELKYCFMSLHHLEGVYWKDDYEKLNLKPLSAEEYFAFYYDQDAENDNEKEMIEKAQPVLEDLAQFKMLTLDEVKKIFPKMYKIKRTKKKAVRKKKKGVV